MACTDEGNQTMIDIHTHILPELDDGANSVEEAKSMLMLQRQQGVDRIFLTPHFYPEEMDLETFLHQREISWNRLAEALEPEVLAGLRLGAEVHYSPNILQLDVRQLTLGKSDYLLLEFSHHRYPVYMEEVISELQERGIIPILAHVERFPYFRREPQLLAKLVDLGCLCQVSAGALFLRRDNGFARACLEHDLAQIVASDAHNLTTRTPCMDEVFRLPDHLRDKIDVFSQVVWEDAVPPPVSPSPVRKGIWGYR